MRAAITSLTLLALGIGSCTDNCETTYTYVYYEPVYSTMAAVRASFELESLPREMSSPGKIYVYGSHLLVNELGSGVHIIDNADPSNPEPIQFITIPGNFDMAVKDNILYADSYMDLLSIDISDPGNPALTHRLEDAFPNYNNQFGFWPPEGQVITEWEEISTVELSEDCSGGNGWFMFEDGIALDLARPNVSQSLTASSPANPTGQAGSMARFAVYQDFLYAVDLSDLNVFDISDVRQPDFESVVQISWGVETIFPFKEQLFIGSQSGMFIYDVTTPSFPVFLSSFMHFTACDPVVANDDYAFVTLRSGSACQGFTNQLDVIDIENILNPKLVKTYPMENPHGLGLDGSTLFICEGEGGLKVYDISDIEHIENNLIKHFPEIHAFDVIPTSSILILIGEDGVYQYDYSDLLAIEQLSFMPITKEESGS